MPYTWWCAGRPAFKKQTRIKQTEKRFMALPDFYGVNIPWLTLSYQHDITEHEVGKDTHNGLSVSTNQLQCSNGSINQSNQILTYFPLNNVSFHSIQLKFLHLSNTNFAQSSASLTISNSSLLGTSLWVFFIYFLEYLLCICFS